jgi:hypothetical protein
MVLIAVSGGYIQANSLSKNKVIVNVGIEWRVVVILVTHGFITIHFVRLGRIIG